MYVLLKYFFSFLEKALPAFVNSGSTLFLAMVLPLFIAIGANVQEPLGQFIATLSFIMIGEPCWAVVLSAGICSLIAVRFGAMLVQIIYNDILNKIFFNSLNSVFKRWAFFGKSVLSVF